MLSKQSLRRHFRQQRRSLSSSEQLRASLRLSARILLSPWFRSAKHIAFYWPADGELSVLPLMKQASKLGKTCYLPIVQNRQIIRNPSATQNNNLIFREYRPGFRLHRNRFGIPEPLPRYNTRPLAQLDAVLLPLVAFDANGNRLGMGAGFYDRAFALLKTHRPLKVGIAHEIQKAQSLPIDTWDVPLHAVITDRKIYRNKKFVCC